MIYFRRTCLTSASLPLISYSNGSSCLVLKPHISFSDPERGIFSKSNPVRLGLGEMCPSDRFLPCCTKTVCSRLMKLSYFGYVGAMARVLLRSAWPKIGRFS